MSSTNVNFFQCFQCTIGWDLILHDLNVEILLLVAVALVFADSVVFAELLLKKELVCAFLIPVSILVL